tara:strand:- start:106 stop:369 length:264 start_codon:yes stop_codon:yes gene_type:complete
MKKKTVNKIWQGKYVSIRDYELKEAIKKGGLLITCQGKEMFIDVDELKFLKPTGHWHQSKFKGKYQLVDILWRETKKDERQGELNGI